MPMIEFAGAFVPRSPDVVECVPLNDARVLHFNGPCKPWQPSQSGLASNSRRTLP